MGRRRAGRGNRLEEEEGSGRSGTEGVVGTGRDIQRNRAPGQAVEVDVDRDRASRGGRLRFGRIGHDLLITLGQQGRRLSLAEHSEIDRPGDRPFVRLHLEPARIEAEVGRAQVVEVLARGIPRRPDGIGHAVGYLPDGAGAKLVDVDRPQLRIEPFGIGDPPRIRAPDWIHRPFRHHVGVTIGLGRLARGHVDDPEGEPGVGKEQLLGIGRPGRREVEGRFRQGDFTRRCGTVGRGNHQAVLSAPVAEVRDPAPIGRPGRVPLGHARRRGQVTPVSLFRRHREDVATGFEDDALAGRRDGGVEDQVLHRFPLRCQPGKSPRTVIGTG